MFNVVLLLLVTQLSIADIQLQNGDATQIYNIEFYLQNDDGSSCGDYINNVQIYSNQQNTWINPAYKYDNKYGFSCNDVPGCEYDLPVSILLSTYNGYPLTLTNIIFNYNIGYIFTTSCQLCRGTQTCYATNPTPKPTANPTVSTKSPTTPTHSPTFSPTNAPTLSPTYLNITTSIAPERNDTVTYLDIQYTLLTILIVLIVSAIFILTCYRFYTRQSNIQILKPIQYTALIAMFSFICSYFSWFISIYSSDKIFPVIEYFTFAIGWLSFYLFMFYKLYHTFIDSVYKMSKTHIYFHIIVAIFIPIWYCVFFGDRKMNTEIHVYLLLAAVGWILTLIGLLLLIVSFNKNLFNAISWQNVISSRSSNIGVIYESDEEDEHQMKQVKFHSQCKKNLSNGNTKFIHEMVDEIQSELHSDGKQLIVCTWNNRTRYIKFKSNSIITVNSDGGDFVDDEKQEIEMMKTKSISPKNSEKKVYTEVPCMD